MEKQPESTIDKKEKLLSQLKKIKARINSLENQKAEKVTKLAKKFKILELSDEIIEQEFSAIRKKYSGGSTDEIMEDSAKKN